MHPYLFDGVRAYPVGMAAAVVVGTLVVARLGRAEGLALWRLIGFQLTVATAALIGAKLHSLAERGALHLFSWNVLVGDGFRYPGGIVGALIAAPLAARLWCPSVSLWRLADIIAFSIPVAMVPVRFGCFLYGCCFGTVSNLPWALSYPPGSPAANYHMSQLWIPDGAPSLPVHPLHFYFLALDLVTVAVLSSMWPRRRFPGQIVLLFLAVHESGKGLLEFVRAADPHQQGHFIQTGPLALSALAIALLLLIRWRRQGVAAAGHPVRA